MIFGWYFFGEIIILVEMITDFQRDERSLGKYKLYVNNNGLTQHIGTPNSGALVFKQLIPLAVTGSGNFTVSSG
jgi:hypothetical protein